MSVKTAVFYTIGCDHLGCPYTIVEAAYDGEGAYLSTVEEVEDVWKDAADELGWKRTADGRSHYCHEHAAIHDDATGADVRPILDPTPVPEPLFGDPS